MSNDSANQQHSGDDALVAKFLADLFATRPDEIQCDAVANDIVQCADRMLTDEAARKRYPAMFHHFRYCRDCAAEYAMVLDFVRQEAAGLVQRPTFIPPPPVYPLVTPPEDEVTRAAKQERGKQRAGADENQILGLVRRIARWAEDAFTPPLQPAPVRGGEPEPKPRGKAREDEPGDDQQVEVKELGEQPATAAMEGGEVTLRLMVKPDLRNPRLCRLLCTVETTRPELEAALDATPIQLVRGEAGEVVEEQTMNEIGDATFIGVAPGVYSLRWSLADQNFLASGLEIS